MKIKINGTMPVASGRHDKHQIGYVNLELDIPDDEIVSMAGLFQDKDLTVQKIRQLERKKGVEAGKREGLSRHQKEINDLKKEINKRERELKEQALKAQQDAEDKLEETKRLAFAECLEAVQKATVTKQKRFILNDKTLTPEEIRASAVEAVENLYNGNSIYNEEDDE